MTARAGLSERQERVLSFIKAYTRKHGWPPTFREIGNGCDISSTSVVDHHLTILERHGLIRREHSYQARNLIVLGEPASYCTCGCSQCCGGVDNA